jgi:hypothetical protein
LAGWVRFDRCCSDHTSDERSDTEADSRVSPLATVGSLRDLELGYVANADSPRRDLRLLSKKQRISSGSGNDSDPGSVAEC